MSVLLVVDDDSGARQAMEDFLTEEGYEVMLAENGRTAIDRMERRRPSLLLTDLEMPDVDGESLIEHTRAHDPALPILVITSRLVVDAHREAQRLCVSGFLNKPISLDDLLDQISAVLDAN